MMVVDGWMFFLWWMNDWMLGLDERLLTGFWLHLWLVSRWRDRFISRCVYCVFALLLGL